ncbi:YggS family pyridoxal phosphate-dependent enzyme [Campylobacter sp. MIT 99-7217]|uniref:YggS family pyridoxal phosphate-dependent enzyme n=1 Tax=Campylobacter sp. MIT 99-7217 TaxID=535091 RepID=UPI00115BE230|nr:YggS family pyridoxal phosphate-dependent enzyme [Campylobacter sp. MIT 99-7217]TQR34491.1 YggS family pyridoxal phosphate-dependent enzyme [Campylobacter sp. MIT 99-7217]
MTLEEILEKTKNVRLIIASKYADELTIKKLAKLGFKEFGENKVQALASKKEALKDESLNIKWHFIGTLQSNKINLLLKQKPILWQSCNSYELACAVDKRLDYTLPCLLEINSANENSKSGLDTKRAIDEYLKIKQECKNLELCGVMSIGAHTEDKKEIIKSFESTYKIYEALQKHGAKICSMGMSGDFELAIKCGSNMLRLGSIIFKALQNQT